MNPKTSEGQDMNGLEESKLLGPFSIHYSWVVGKGLRTTGPHSTGTYSLEITTPFRSKLTQGKSTITPALALDYLGKAVQSFHVKL